MRRLAALLIVLACASCPGGSSPPGETCGSRTECGGACVDTRSDPAHCGDCDTACTEEAPNCAAGVCVPDCGAQLARCDGACVSLGSDAEHCGSCDRACGDEAPVCAGGECVALCPEGTRACGDACADVESDPTHCGDCATACRAEERCRAGRCEVDVACGEGEELCDGRCLCGGCDGVVCAPGDECRDGVCTCPEDDCGPCPGGQTDCDPAIDRRDCRDLQNDEASCGSCGVVCLDDQSCDDGECEDECQEGECSACNPPCGEGQVCVGEDACADVVPTSCLACPCDECPENEEPEQRCCTVESEGELEEVICVAADDCPEDEL